jgi:hypothetical protein
MRFSFMSDMAFRIATLKRSWKKEGLMLIMLRSIVGLSVMRQPHDIVIGLLINKVEFGLDIHA